MSWVAVGTMAALGAVQGNQQRQAQAKANQQNADISAAQTQYSPWTNIKPQGVQMGALGGGALGGAEQGALAGAMYSKALGGQKAAQGAALTKEFDAMPSGGPSMAPAMNAPDAMQMSDNPYTKMMQQKKAFGYNV